LYENATEFISRHHLWMNSQVGSHDPEEISTDVDTCYRTISKLEKAFAEQLVVKDLTSTVSTIFFTSLCRRQASPINDSFMHS
jgi:hypothetical protein